MWTVRRGWAGVVLVLVSVLAACEPAVTDDGDTLEPLHEEITPEMLVAPEVDGDDGEVATDDVIQGAWVSEGVIDGQTLLLVSEGQSVRIRLAGIDTPTGLDCLAGLAIDTLRFVVGGGRQLSLDTDIAGRSNDVLPGYVATIEGDDLGAVMLRLGLAEIDPSTLDEAYRDTYQTELEAAQDEAVGIWADDACDDEAVTDE